MDMPSLTLKVTMYMALCFQWGYKILGLEYISFYLSHSYMSLDQCKEIYCLEKLCISDKMLLVYQSIILLN